MTIPPRLMLLIDADNVSEDVIAQAVQRVTADHGAPRVCRAYCSLDKAREHEALFRSLRITPIVNLPTGKNCTDMMLAVDAIDLAASLEPQVVAIVSSDSDFAPLVGRLREKGCSVIGLGQVGKTSADTPAAYDGFIALDHRKAPARSRPAKVARKAAVAPAAKRTPAKRAAASPPMAPSPAPPPPPPPLPDAVRAVVEAVPELAGGAFVQLGVVAEKLRAAKLLGKTVSSAKLLAKHGRYFEVLPDKQPNRVRLLEPW